MFSNVPTDLIVAGLVAVIALPFVVVACSIYVADRVIGALRPIYRLLKEQAAASQRFATAIPATSATVPAPQPTAATLVPPSTTSPAQTQAAAPAPGSAAADSSPEAPTEPPPTQHTEAELEAQRARIRQMIQGR